MAKVKAEEAQANLQQVMLAGGFLTTKGRARPKVLAVLVRESS